jgi:DNA/RNA-binding domain of Phe-tRNA-synthetase-like protein
MAIRVDISPELPNLHIGVVEVAELVVGASNDELIKYCNDVARRVKLEADSEQRQQQCQEIRQLLRFGKFKATGRSKPAQEYLMRCIANDGALPKINAPVDLLNAVSVDCNLPISLLSVAKCSAELLIARGKTGDNFVFNSAGQILDLTDLITVYDRSVNPPRPVGTPIKDSMAGKIELTDRHCVAIIYAANSAEMVERCEQAKQRLAAGFRLYCQGDVILAP